MRFRVVVPATTANLGPGFDALGMALDLVNEMEVEVHSGPHHVSVEGEGTGSLPSDERHLALQAAQWYCQQHGQRLPGLRLRQVNRIPLARGLGSSAATIVAGLCAAAYLMGRDGRDLLEAATRLEGHPDNVAPALRGGLVASAMREHTVVDCAMPLHPCWKVAVAIPQFELSTEAARKVLPASVPRADAVFNLSRVAVLLGALRDGHADNLELASEDRLHQPYRCALVPGLEQVMAAAREAGAAAAFLSGAGPTVAAWVDTRTGDAERVTAVMGATFAAHGVTARGLELAPSAQGACCASL